jgi:hypothetical protein
MVNGWVLAGAIAGASSGVAGAPSPPTDFQAMFADAQAHPDAPAFARAHPDAFVHGPVWVERPDAGELSAAYPSMALPGGPTGFAMLICQVTEEGRLDPCAVIREQPARLGFGDAAIRLSHRFALRREDRPAGVRVAGRYTYLPIRFDPPRR